MFCIFDQNITLKHDEHKVFFMVAIGVFVLASCNLNQVDQTGLLTASVRDALNSPATLSIADEIESVEYIPLK